MAVALNHLRCHRRGLQTQPRADLLFHVGTDVRERSDRARNLAHPQIFRRGFETPLIAPRFLVPDGELQAERDGLGVDAVRAADLHGVFEFDARGASALRAASPRPPAESATPGGAAAPARYPPRRSTSCRSGTSARRPACPAAAIDSATAVVNAITSCRVCFSISKMRGTSKEACRRSSTASSAGTTPSSASVSEAASSTSSHC